MRPAVTLSIGLLALAVTAWPAAAQFSGRSVYSRGFSVSYVTPYGGYYLTQQRFSTTFYNYPTFNYGGIYPVPNSPPIVGTYGLTPAFYGSIGTPTAGVGMATEVENIRRAQRAVRNDPVARRKVVDDAPMPGGKKVGDKAADAGPTDADVLSGRALNVLAFEVSKLQGAGNGRSPFLPPETLAHVVFAGGPQADAMNLFRGEVPSFPDALRLPSFEPARQAVAKEYFAVVEALKAGKPADHATLDRLAVATHALKEQFAPVLRASAGADPDHAADFLNRIDAAAAHLKTPAANELLVPAWHSVGVSAADLVRHLAKYKVEFAPAPADDDGAYWAVYRGLAAYKKELLSK